jgi:protein-tyrosine phosphatase
VIDLHTHIIPGLDHGPGDWDEALEMCRIAVADGIATLAATPHISEIYPNSPQGIETAADELRRRLADAGIPLAVVVGGDHHLRPDLSPQNVMTLGGNRGLSPIVTHPERIFSLQREWRRLEPLMKAGALVQVTAGSLLGEFGPAATAAANRFLKKGWVHLLASDAHWIHARLPRLAAGRDAAARIVGESAAQALVDQNPQAILEGRNLAGR